MLISAAPRTPYKGRARVRRVGIVERVTRPVPWFISYPVLVLSAFGGFSVLADGLERAGL